MLLVLTAAAGVKDHWRATLARQEINRKEQALSFNFDFLVPLWCLPLTKPIGILLTQENVRRVPIFESTLW